MTLILLNGLSIAAVLAWIGLHYLKALGRAYGNANPATGPGDIAWVFILVAIGAAACIVVSFLVSGGTARVIALAPILLVLAAQGYISLRTRANVNRHHERNSAERAARDRALERIPRSYILKETKPDHYAFRESFLTHDTETDTIARIDVGFNSEISAFCVGRVIGDRLELFAKETDPVDHYRKYLDPVGRSVFDRYTIGFNPDQDYKTYRLERYEP